MNASAAALIRFHDGPPVQKQFGEKLRLLVVEGADQNACFCLVGEKIVIGRETGNDIQLDDAKTSRKHAEIRWVFDHYEVFDLGSANGVYINSRKVPKAKLTVGETLIIGLTAFEVIPAGQASKRKPTLSKPLKPKVVSVAATNNNGEEDEKKVAEKQQIARNRIIVFGGAFLLLMLVMSGSEDHVKTFRERAKVEIDEEGIKPQKKKVTKKEAQAALEEYLNNSGKKVNTPQRKQADAFFLSAMREWQNSNYRRALTAFQTALAIDPTHEAAKIYLDLAEKDFQTEIDKLLKEGLQAKSALRLQSAKQKFRAVMRLLDFDPKNENYIKAEEKLKQIQEHEGQ